MLAANRDERLDRAWDPPGPHWPERPGVMAGRDRLGGGTWMAARRGLVAAVLNRPGSLGPASGKLSRGDLPLLAAGHASAIDAARAIGALDAGAYRSFNMVIADRGEALFVRGLGDGQPEITALTPGVHMVTAHDPDNMASPRVARHLPRFRAATAPDTDGWVAWRTLLADGSGPGGSELNVTARGGFGTVCASLLSIGREDATEWLFAAGPPDTVAFRPVALPV